MRNRLSCSPLSVPVTYTPDVNVYENEAFILDEAIEKHKFPHWVAHLVALHLKLTKAEDPYFCGDEFPKLRSAVADSLSAAGFHRQASEIRSITSEEEMNKLIVRQYTEETPLYSEVNQLLRYGHEGRNVGQEPLVPWALQLNAAIRRLPIHYGKTYRGAMLESEAIAEYEVGRIFVWSSFTSMSLSEDYCKDGNVLFDIHPFEAFSLHDKNAGRIISSLSQYEEEQEVLLPICSGFRVTSRTQESGRLRINLEILDSY